MSDACIVAAGAVSALGVGPEAWRAAEPGEPARVGLARDEVLAAAGLARPFAGRAPALPPMRGSEDRATHLLGAALAQLVAGLDAVRPGWRGARLGIAVGTSSGGMLTAERLFAARAAGAADADLAALGRGATYFAPLDDALAAFDLGGVARRTQVLAACAASTIAIGLGLRWLDRGACDLVLAGGYDAVSVFVAAGFEALRATTASRPRPFRIGRDGMSLGEGAGLVALVRETDAGTTVLGRVAGFGASTDAVHITAPDRTGGGLARAAAAAIADAGVAPADLALVSAHATATPYNDAMESRAIAAATGGSPAVHPFKAQIGHTLGAAGVLEPLATADAIARGVLPAAAGEGELDAEAPARLLDRGEAHPIPAALKLSAAFGGANAALVLTRAPSGRRPRATRPVHLAGWAHVADVDLVELAQATGIARDRLARLDPLCRLAMAAVAALAAKVGRARLEGAGVVAGHGFATIDTNDLFDAKKRAKGPTAVEPRLFPATSPNALAGEVAIPFRLTGPGFAVGAGLDGATEALAAASELVVAADAERMVVLAADDAGPVATTLHRLLCPSRPLARGAVAALLDAAPGGPEIALDALVPDHAAGPIGHLALLDRLRAYPGSGA